MVKRCSRSTTTWRLNSRRVQKASRSRRAGRLSDRTAIELQRSLLASEYLRGGYRGSDGLFMKKLIASASALVLTTTSIAYAATAANSKALIESYEQRAHPAVLAQATPAPMQSAAAPQPAPAASAAPAQGPAGTTDIFGRPVDAQGRTVDFQPAKPPGPSMAPATSPDAMFVSAVVRSNDNENTAARNILKSTKNASVRDYASKMLEDQSTANVSLEVTARNAHVVLDERARTNAMRALKLRDATAAVTDRAYMQGQVSAHTDTLALLSPYADRGANAALKAYAATQAASVQAHLDLAKGVLAVLPARPAGVATAAPAASAAPAMTAAPTATAAPSSSTAPAPAATASPNPQPSTGIPNLPAPVVTPSPKP